MGGRGSGAQLSEKGLAFLRAIPADRLLLETDSPDQLPVQFQAPRLSIRLAVSDSNGDGDGDGANPVRAAATADASTSPGTEEVSVSSSLQYNEPALVRFHCLQLAQLLGVDAIQFAEQTTRNAFTAFGINESGNM